MFFVSVASKGLSNVTSPLESTLARPAEVLILKLVTCDSFVLLRVLILKDLVLQIKWGLD